MERQVAVEAEEEVLAVGVDARTARPASRSGQRSIACRGCGVSIETISSPDQRRADPVGGGVDRVSLRH